ncbi:hypothetical protein A0G_1368 [Streptococcus iniae 9117]|nr:hypothetical protein A0G_1368 [Streptococcus iniae 9117]ESR09130.1 hypothetical protein IUSA1_08455 [Streptococcus iniae IUSA1]
MVFLFFYTISLLLWEQKMVYLLLSLKILKKAVNKGKIVKD